MASSVNSMLPHSHLDEPSPHNIPVVFFFNGVTAVLGWNCVLTSLDYFNWVYPSYNIFLYFPIPCFVGATIISLTFAFISALVEVRKIIFWSLLGVITFLILLLANSFI